MGASRQEHDDQQKERFFHFLETSSICLSADKQSAADFILDVLIIGRMRKKLEKITYNFCPPRMNCQSAIGDQVLTVIHITWINRKIATKTQRHEERFLFEYSFVSWRLGGNPPLADAIKCK